MAGAREIKAGEAFIVISAKMDSLKADLKKSQAQLRSWGTNLSSLGGMLSSVFAGVGIASATAALSGAVNQFVQAGSALTDLAGRTGRTASELAHLKFMAEQSGASVADLETAFRAMANNGRSASDFEAIAAQIAAIDDPSQRAAAAMQEFGRAGTKLLPMLGQWNSLKSSSQSLGPILSEAEIQAADRLGDAFGALREAASRATQQIGQQLAGTVEAFVNTITGLIVKVSVALDEMNAAGRGGDWLDRYSETFWALFNPSELRRMGQQATAGMAGVSPGGVGELLDEPNRAAEEADRRAQMIWDRIRSAYDARQNLIQQFETPAEQFLRRQQEIVEAMKSLHRARLLGEVGQGEAITQQRGLQTAMARLQSEEMRRVAEERQRMMEAVMGSGATMRAAVAGGASGTGNAGAARLLGRSGEARDRRMDEQTSILRRIERNTGRTIGGVAFS